MCQVVLTNMLCFFFIIWVFKFCHNHGFWVFSSFELLSLTQFEFWFLPPCYFLSFVKILFLWHLLQFDFFSSSIFFMILVFDFSMILVFLQFKVLSLVPVRFFELVTMWVLKFCHDFSFFELFHTLGFLALSQFDIWVLLQLKHLGFVTIWLFEFCQNFIFWFWS